MNLFHSNTEMLVFSLLAIVFAGVITVTILMLYSPAFMQSHPIMANRMFNSKSTKLGRLGVLVLLAIGAHLNQCLMLETLFLAIIVYHVGMLVFFRNKGFVNLSARKY
jgi:hypothetical protein